MLPFFTLVWDIESEEQRSVVFSLRRALAEPEWTIVFEQPGISVHCRTLCPTSHDICKLQDSKGVVIGTLFSQISPDKVCSRRTRLDASESGRIIDSAGRDLIESYWGRYVAFLCDPIHRTCWVIRDPSGEQECLTALHHGVAIYFSSMADCRAFDLLKFSLNWNYVVASLVNLTLAEGRETGIRELTHVLAGECVEISEGAKRRRYWHPCSIAKSRATERAELAESQLRDTTRACVRAWASCHTKVCHLLSGGLDSSIVLACLSKFTDGPDVLCLNSFYSRDTNYDERHFARLMADRTGFRLIEQENSANFDARLIRTLPLHPTPSNTLLTAAGTVSQVPIAQEYGATAIFTGGGGDGVFFVDGPRYAYGDELFRVGVRSTPFRVAMRSARASGSTVWKTIFGSVRDSILHSPESSVRSHILSGNTALSCITKDAARSIRSRLRFIDQILDEAAGLPFGKIMHIYNTADVFGMDTIGEPNAPDRVHPLVAQPLKELALSLPTALLAADGLSRGLIRRAFRGLVPDEILYRFTKSGPAVYIDDLVENNLLVIRETLLDGELVRERVIDKAELESALNGQITKKVGAAAEICCMYSVEAWLQQWRGRLGNLCTGGHE